MMQKYLKGLRVKNKDLTFPTFFPDATRGVIRSLDSIDLVNAKVEGLITNTYHLMTQPGSTVIKNLGGMKGFARWPGFIITDSGGFQLLSMIYQDKSFGKISKDGVTFYQGSKGNKKKYSFTPEKCIQTQFNLEADIMICLDDCPPINPKEEDLKISVQRTVEWAKRCREEFDRQIKSRKLNNENRPLLFGVIQGGSDKELRKQCADELIKIGFDGFGFGGWPLDENKKIDMDILAYTASLVPEHLPKYALGIGDPYSIVQCVKAGWNIFDCVLPTRDARHHRLYNFTKEPEQIKIFEEENITSYLHILKEDFVRDSRPVSEYCDCFTCQHYSRAYLHHLFRIEDSLAFRLSTIHNLRTYTKLIELLRKEING